MGPAFAEHAREKLARGADVPGMIACYVAGRVADDGRDEYLVISAWETIEAFRAVVGDEGLDRAFLQPDDRAYLDDATVEYYQLAAAVGRGIITALAADPEPDAAVPILIRQATS